MHLSKHNAGLYNLSFSWVHYFFIVASKASIFLVLRTHYSHETQFMWATNATKALCQMQLIRKNKSLKKVKTIE